MTDEHRLAAKELGRVTAKIDDLFRYVEVAEEEIARQKLLRSDSHEVIHKTFLHLQPSSVLWEHGSERLYRKHCQELIQRAVDSKPLRSATTAEVVAALSRMSELGPLSRPAEVAYWDNVSKLFPDQAERTLAETGPVAANDRDRSRAKEIEHELRQQLTLDREEPEPDQELEQDLDQDLSR